MKQQNCRCSISGDDQHGLAGARVRGIVSDRIFDLLSVVLVWLDEKVT
jgi:hypothetical protein